MALSIVTLAQQTGPAMPPPLPSPPPLVHYTVENPWVLAGLLGLVSVVCLYLLLTARAGKHARAVAVAAAASVFTAVAVILAAQIVTTQREALIQQTRQLIAATAAADTAELGPMLGSSLALRVLGTSVALSREQTLDLVRRYPGQQTRVDSHTITESQATLDGPNVARTQVHVRVRSNDATLYDVPVGTWWMIEWRRGEDGWKVTGLRCLHIDGMSPETNIGF